MKISRCLQISALFTALCSPALADEVAPQGQAHAPKENSAKPAESAHADAATALPSLPLFELPAQASDAARLHVGLAHERRDTSRAEHTRQAPATDAAARDHRAAAQLQSEAARLHKADGQAHRDAAGERRAEAEGRRAAALLHRDAATERRLNAQSLRAAAQERRASAGQK
jgi:hypothetical protein